MFRHHVVNDCITFINDPSRNRWYQHHISNLVRDKNVLEIGCGSGILAAYALESGCSHYYGVDIKSDRAKFTTNILDRLGYRGRYTVWCADGATLSHEDFPGNVAVVICEQTGHQMQSNFTIRQFWTNLSSNVSKLTSIPDAWHLDAYVYHGILDSDLSEYQPRALLDDSSLPNGYYQVLLSTDFVQPAQVINDVLKLTLASADNDLEFVIDLSTYESATIVFRDHTSFQNSICPSSSALRDWPCSVKIVIPQANGKFCFRWNANKRKMPLFRRGFWDWKKL